MAHKRTVHKYRKRKFERMLDRMNEVEYMIIPGEKPGSMIHATNVLLTRGEVEFLKRLLAHGVEVRSVATQRERDITETVALVLQGSREKRARKKDAI